jgi:phage shock protein PspC (stress-responsive transcriptional regulator)
VFNATFNNISVTLVSFFVVVVNFHGLAATERFVDIYSFRVLILLLLFMSFVVYYILSACSMTSQQSAATDGDAGKGKKKKKGWVSSMSMYMNMERRMDWQQLRGLLTFIHLGF